MSLIIGMRGRKELLYTEINHDRASSSTNLIPIVKMGDIYLNAYPKVGENHSLYPKAPIDVVWCPDSYLLQNLQTVSRFDLYDEYWYVSGIQPTMVKHLRDVVKLVANTVELKSGDTVLDIASNDGTLLRQYKHETEGIKTIGYDPACNLKKAAEQGVTNHYPKCFDPTHYQSYHPRAKVITACAVIYHMPDLVKALQDVALCLENEGVFICEFTYLPTMMKNNAFDSIGHEHLTHLSLRSFERALLMSSLAIESVQLGSMNAGTILCVIKHAHQVVQDVDDQAFLQGLRTYEFELGLHSSEPYYAFATRGELLRYDLKAALEELHKQGKSVYAYGASTKGSILLQWAGIDNRLVQKAVERNPSKVGREMVGLEIPIIDEKQARKENPDVMLVLPWHFREEFIEREKDYLTNGGLMLFPLPTLDIVSG